MSVHTGPYIYVLRGVAPGLTVARPGTPRDDSTPSRGVSGATLTDLTDPGCFSAPLARHRSRVPLPARWRDKPADFAGHNLRNADNAIAANRKSIRTLDARLNQLRQKQQETGQDRQEIIALTGQISALQRDIQLLQPNSSAYVRNNVKWVERPTSPTQPVPSEEPAMEIPSER